jgi:hypothetical protein
MATSPIIINGEELKPIFTRHQLMGRPFVAGNDEHGPYVACHLGTQNPSYLYGWYALVSPEDLPVMKDHTWGGFLTSRKGKFLGVNVRRGERIDGVKTVFYLGQVIWTRAYHEDPPEMIYRIWHPLDFRRPALSRYPNDPKRRGIGWQKKGHGWNVSIAINSQREYIGFTKSPDEGYRMFNRYLRDLKAAKPDDKRIQAMLYNEIDPLF